MVGTHYSTDDIADLNLKSLTLSGFAYITNTGNALDVSTAVSGPNGDVIAVLANLAQTGATSSLTVHFTLDRGATFGAACYNASFHDLVLSDLGALYLSKHPGLGEFNNNLNQSSPTIFQQTTAATNGPLSGQYLWSNPDNWTNGIPIDGSNVVGANYSTDDIANLNLNSLTLSGIAHITVAGSTLDVSTVVSAPSGDIVALLANSELTGATSGVTVHSISGPGATFGAAGYGATFDDLVSSDPGATYVSEDAGLVEFSNNLNQSSILAFYTAGVFVFDFAPATVSAEIFQLTPGNAFEVQGTVNRVDIGSNSVSIATDAGVYQLNSIQYAQTVGGYTIGIDPRTGLNEVTFKGT